MAVSLVDRIVSSISYFTFGIFSIIWLVYANLTKTKITPFLAFNMYQAIFISVVFAVISLIYSIAINLMSVIPFVGKFVKIMDVFINQTPLYFSFTLTGLFTVIVVSYLIILSMLGKRPFVPMVSDVIQTNFGG